MDLHVVPRPFFRPYTICNNSTALIWDGTTLIKLAFPPPTVSLLVRHGVCRKVAINIILTQRRKRNIVCVKIYNFKIHRFIFAFAHSDVNKPNMHEEHGRTSEGCTSFPLCCHFLFSSVSDDSLSTNQRSAVSPVPPFRYQTTVLGTPTEGSQKVLRYCFAIFVPFTNEPEIIAYCTVLNHTARWKSI